MICMRFCAPKLIKELYQNNSNYEGTAEGKDLGLGKDLRKSSYYLSLESLSKNLSVK